MVFEMVFEMVFDVGRIHLSVLFIVIQSIVKGVMSRVNEGGITLLLNQRLQEMRFLPIEGNYKMVFLLCWRPSRESLYR